MLQLQVVNVAREAVMDDRETVAEKAVSAKEAVMMQKEMSFKSLTEAAKSHHG